MLSKSPCPILRAFCEGWDQQILTQAFGYPTLCKERKGWGTAFCRAFNAEIWESVVEGPAVSFLCTLQQCSLFDFQVAVQDRRGHVLRVSLKREGSPLA
jgi:hypothetical protein